MKRFMLTRPSKLVTVIPWQVHSKILPVDCQWEQTRIWPTKGPEYASVLPSPARTPHYPGQSVYTIVDCNRCKLPESGTRRGWKYIPHHSCNWTEDGLEGNSITIFSQPPHVAELVKFFFFWFAHAWEDMSESIPLREENAVVWPINLG